MNTELYNEILEGIANGDYNILDTFEESHGLYLTILCENDKVVITYDDFTNQVSGGHYLQSQDVLKMSLQEFESALGEIYYFNCNIPM